MSTTEAHPASEFAVASPTSRPKFNPTAVLRRFVASVGVLFLYGPHVWMIRKLPRRRSLQWTKCLARLHYWTTYLGLQRGLLKKFQAIHPHVDQQASPREMLRRYIEVKHLSFAELRMSTTDKGYRAYCEAQAEVHGIEHLHAAHSHGKGVLFVIYHHGMYKVMQPWVTEIVKNDSALGDSSVLQAAYLSAHYSQKVYGWVARLALRDSIDTAARGKLEYIHLKPEPNPLPIVRRLRKRDMVGLAADGVLSADFLKVRFLDGALELPSGWARLAAITGAPVVSSFQTSDDENRHHLTFHEPIHVADRTDEQIELAVQRCADQLEEHVRARPWEWHIWHRIQLLNEAGEPPHLYINPAATERSVYYNKG